MPPPTYEIAIGPNNAQTVRSLQRENRLLMIEIKINIVKVNNYGCVIARLTIQINFNLQMGAWMRHAGKIAIDFVVIVKLVCLALITLQTPSLPSCLEIVWIFRPIRYELVFNFCCYTVVS